MHRITDKNFKQYFPRVKEALEKASFIAIDAEFSGLQAVENDEVLASESLFDSPAERYAKQRRNIEPFVAVQFGLTAFTRVRHENKYTAESFSFHLLPRALPTKNRSFLVQADALEFLATCNFDFNRLAYDGISWLDEEEEARLSTSLKDGSLEQEAFGSYAAREEAERCFDTVQKWSRKEPLLIRTSDRPAACLIQKELRRSFKNIWTEPAGTNEFLVIGVTADVRRALEEKNVADILDDELLDYYTGFSKVFKVMTSLKKPIVGHNLFLDLMFAHKQFFAPLPEKYETFKRNIKRLFPLVYDTKFISFEMKKVSNAVAWKSNILADLYKYYKEGPGRYSALNSPRIELAGSTAEEVKFHDAAWDSYCTGYCFARMAHAYAVRKISKDAEMRELTNAEIMSAIGELANRINLIRADLSHLRLDGPDPASTRPRWLLVRTSTNDSTTRRIARAFSRFGAVDVKRRTENEVLVAVSNHGVAREILEYYKGSDEFRIVPYNPLRHSSRTIKAVAWVGSLLLSGAGIWILQRGSASSRP